MVATIGLLHNSLNVQGGSERLTLDLIQVLKGQGYRVHLATFDKPDWARIEENMGCELVRPDRCLTILPWRPRIFRIYQNIPLMMGVERLAHGVDLTINTIGVYGGKQFCRTDIVYVHGVGRGTVEYPWWKLPYALPYELMMLANRRLAARRPRSMFIANSRYTERKLLSCCGIQASRIIYPPVHTEVYRKLLTEKKRQDLAITIGRYSPERQLESIIGIAKRIRLGLRFVVIGYASKPSEFAILRSLLAQADQFGLPIDFLMNETQERKQELIAQAKVVIQPSRMEHFGIALCEAISGGCLPVTINDGGHLEVLETLGPLAQIYGNYEEAARAVESAMDSWSLKHAKRASEQMEQFNMQRFSQQICQFIEEFDL